VTVTVPELPATITKDAGLVPKVRVGPVEVPWQVEVNVTGPEI
jgi:hypothetical protein